MISKHLVAEVEIKANNDWMEVEHAELLEKFKPGTVIRCTKLPYYAVGTTIGKEYTLIQHPDENALVFIDDHGDYNYGCNVSLTWVIEKRLKDYGWEVVEQEMSSKAFLQQAINVQTERAKDYEQEGGERSIAKLVIAFNAITGHNLTEEEGWLFLQTLKDIRQWSTPHFHEDSALDSVSYAALKAEALARNKPKKGE